MARSTFDTAVGITLVILGAASLLGWLSLGWIVTVAAVAAVVVGLLVLLGKMKGSTLFGVVLLVAGILLLVPNFIGDVIGNVITTVAAIVLLILGIMKLMGKW